MKNFISKKTNKPFVSKTLLTSFFVLISILLFSCGDLQSVLDSLNNDSETVIETDTKTDDEDSDNVDTTQTTPLLQK